MFKYAEKIDQNITCGSSYKHLHLKTSASLNDARQSLIPILHTSGWTMLASMQNAIRIYHVVQEL